MTGSCVCNLNSQANSVPPSKSYLVLDNSQKYNIGKAVFGHLYGTYKNIIHNIIHPGYINCQIIEEKTVTDKKKLKINV